MIAPQTPSEPPEPPPAAAPFHYKARRRLAASLSSLPNTLATPAARGRGPSPRKQARKSIRPTLPTRLLPVPPSTQPPPSPPPQVFVRRPPPAVAPMGTAAGAAFGEVVDAIATPRFTTPRLGGVARPARAKGKGRGAGGAAAAGAGAGPTKRVCRRISLDAGAATPAPQDPRSQGPPQQDGAVWDAIVSGSVSASVSPGAPLTASRLSEQAPPVFETLLAATGEKGAGQGEGTPPCAHQVEAVIPESPAVAATNAAADRAADGGGDVVDEPTSGPWGQRVSPAVPAWSPGLFTRQPELTLNSLRPTATPCASVPPAKATVRLASGASGSGQSPPQESPVVSENGDVPPAGRAERRAGEVSLGSGRPQPQESPVVVEDKAVASASPGLFSGQDALTLRSHGTAAAVGDTVLAVPEATEARDVPPEPCRVLESGAVGGEGGEPADASASAGSFSGEHASTRRSRGSDSGGSDSQRRGDDADTAARDVPESRRRLDIKCVGVNGGGGDRAQHPAQRATLAPGAEMDHVPESQGHLDGGSAGDDGDGSARRRQAARRAATPSPGTDGNSPWPFRAATVPPEPVARHELRALSPVLIEGFSSRAEESEERLSRREGSLSGPSGGGAATPCLVVPERQPLSRSRDEDEIEPSFSTSAEAVGAANASLPPAVAAPAPAPTGLVALLATTRGSNADEQTSCASTAPPPEEMSEWVLKMRDKKLNSSRAGLPAACDGDGGGDDDDDDDDDDPVTHYRRRLHVAYPAPAVGAAASDGEDVSLSLDEVDEEVEVDDGRERAESGDDGARSSEEFVGGRQVEGVDDDDDKDDKPGDDEGKATSGRRTAR